MKVTDIEIFESDGVEYTRCICDGVKVLVTKKDFAEALSTLWMDKT